MRKAAPTWRYRRVGYSNQSATIRSRLSETVRSNQSAAKTNRLLTCPAQAELSGEGYDSIREGVMRMVAGHFRPEFVNRIDEFIVFQPLRRAQIAGIVRMQANRVAKRVAEKKVALTLTDAAIEYLSAKGFDPVYGAR